MDFNAQTEQKDSAPIVYFCGCKRLFENKVSFKQHVLQNHKGAFVGGSSHFLTIVSHILLPVKRWNKQRYAFFLTESSENGRNCDIVLDVQVQEEEIQHQKELMLIDNSKNQQEKKQKRKRGRPKKIKNLPTKTNKEPIKWNGFLLIPNSTCTKQGFFCGKCQKQLNSLQVFVMHCFDQCQQLQNPMSSHSIQIEKEKNEVENKPQIRKSPQTLPKVYPILNRLKNAEKNYLCGCGYFTNVGKSQKAFRNHLLHNHQEIVPQNSSHVFLVKLMRPFGHLYRRYFFLKVDGPDEDDFDWYCPCKPEKIMNRRRFIIHISKVHKGVSPAYNV